MIEDCCDTTIQQGEEITEIGMNIKEDMFVTYSVEQGKLKIYHNNEPVFIFSDMDSRLLILRDFFETLEDM